MDTTFRLPGTTEPEITVRRPFVGGIKVLVDGVPAKRRRSRSLSYDIPLADGSTTELQLKGQWTGLKTVVNGVETPLEPRQPRWTIVLTFLPLILVILGGLIGALFAIGAAAVNARVARTSMATPIKVLVMLGATALAVVLYFGVVIAIAPVPKLETGTCVNGIHEGASVTAANSRPVDCAGPHDNEVVGTIQDAGQGAYPGQAALETSAQTGCVAAFDAYVGGDYASSSLSMLPVIPDELAWAKGDRDIDCVVLNADGTKLTGSVKGTGR